MHTMPTRRKAVKIRPIATAAVAELAEVQSQKDYGENMISKQKPKHQGSARRDILIFDVRAKVDK